MKKGFAILLAALLCLIACAAMAETFELNGVNCEYTVSDGKITIQEAGNSIAGKVEIPSAINGTPVTAIGENAFYNLSGITELVLPESVTSIGYGAFAHCDGLKSVTINGAITSFGEHAFSYCRGLHSVSLAEGTTQIGACAFLECSALGEIQIPGSVTSIGSSAFDRSALKSVELPDGLKSIGESAFNRCLALESVTIPGSVEEMGSAIFGGCTALEHVTIREGVTKIGQAMFNHCLALESVVIPMGVTTIEKGAFSSCESLTSVTLPESLKQIGEEAFYKAPIESVVISTGVEQIRKFAFSKVKKVEFESGTPPTLAADWVGKKAYSAVEEIRVPCGTKDAYKAAISEDFHDKIVCDDSCKKTVSVSMPVEGGTVSGAGKYEVGERVTLKAEADEGYEFVGWQVNGEIVSEDSEYTFIASGDTEVTAVFEKIVVPDLPKTGDDSALLLWTLTLVASAAASMALGRRTKEN